jgi:positive regulator of sigma E activity
MYKKNPILLLYILNSLIFLSGCLFAVYSIYFKTSFRVINTDVSGAIIGLLVSYFSIRHFKKIFDLKRELKKSENSFSWSNFKKVKKGVL